MGEQAERIRKFKTKSGKVIEVPESRIEEMMNQATFDSVVTAICTGCEGDIDVEPDATTGYCYECEDVKKVIAPITIFGI